MPLLNRNIHGSLPLLIHCNFVEAHNVEELGIERTLVGVLGVGIYVCFVNEERHVQLPKL